MTKVIYKYALELGITTLDLPVDAEVLHVALQNEQLQMWVLFPLASEKWKRLRHFQVVGTGHNFEHDQSSSHVGTVLAEGAYVWHVFEVARS